MKDVVVCEILVDPSMVRWERPEFKDRWSDLVTRKKSADLLGVDLDAFSALRKNYSEGYPRVVARFGTHILLAKEEVEEFGRYVEEVRGSPTRHAKRTHSRDPLVRDRNSLSHARMKRENLEARLEKAKRKVKYLRDEIAAIKGEERLLEGRIAATEVTLERSED